MKKILISLSLLLSSMLVNAQTNKDSLRFELRDYRDNGYTINKNMDTVTFNITPIIGIVGNTYAGFLSTSAFIYIKCPMNASNTVNQTRILAEAKKYVKTKFPTIKQ